ncbi:UNVERIFIED_CONTAM: hypothetical protein Sradi_5737800 [Sesamum radiatum]|uniref:Transposase MuDR plant domain-containing protein n=1 Tax=Sesamum radiatum TaxID=300843 RepID=A0AAW2L2D0_SESRA
MGDKMYDLEIHFKSKCKKLKNIDPDKYSYIDFIADIRELHRIIDETIFRVTCSVDDSDMNMDISNDNDVLSMFGRNVNRVSFDVFIELANEERESGDENMEKSGDESGDESMEESGDESGNESMEEFGDKIRETNNQTGVVSGDEMSDYKSDNHCESKNQSDSELEDNPLKGSLNRDACLLPSETGSKVKLEKRIIFVDINAFRKTLKEFVIQEGFKIMRMRNEKIRVTAHCSVKDCPWRIHAAPLVDGVTFQVKTYVPNHTCVR